MSVEDNVQVCAVLRNFRSDTEYLHLEDFWIEKLTEDDKKNLSKDLTYFVNYPWGDNHIAARWYYIGRGKSSTVLRDNNMMFFIPLFRAMKLFKKGDLIIPLVFYRWKGKWYETRFHGDSYGIGSWLGKDDDPYILNKDDVEAFNIFRNEIESYLKYINFPEMPYRKKHKILSDIDTRCFLPIYILLKGSMEHHNRFPVIDALIEYTLALESLYLHGHEPKRRKLSARISILLGKDESEEKQLRRDIKKFYDIRSAVVHGSLMDEKQYSFLCANICDYGDYLRRSILAFLDLNATDKSKKAILKRIDDAISNSGWHALRRYFSSGFRCKTDLRTEIRDSLKMLKLSK
jgi:hypothetical protein